MSNKVISIDVGIHTTRLCEVDYNKRNPRVYSCISFSTPEHTFEDGFIKDKDTFTAVIKEKIEEAGMKSRKVVFTVSSSKIANREVVIPLVKNNRIQDIINANASEYFPVDVSEYVVSYSILQRINTKELKKLRLLVVAAPDSLIKSYYHAAKILGLDVIAIDYIGNSIYQMIRKQVNSGTNLVIQMEEQSTLINIMEEELLGLQRTLPYGTSAVIHEVLTHPYFNISNKKDARQLLCNNEIIRFQLDSFESEAAISIAPSAANVIETKAEEAELSAIDELMDSLRYLISNILRVLDYYYSKNRDKTVNTIFITGEGAKFKGIEKLLNHEIGIEVKKIVTLDTVTFAKNDNPAYEYQSDYISCIGACFHPIHFEPKEYFVREKKRNNIHSIIVIFSTAVVLSLALVSTSVLNYKTSKLNNADLHREIAGLEEVNAIYDAHAIAVETYDAVITMYAMTNNPNERLNEFIAELEEKLPSNVIVETFNVTSTVVTLSIKGDSKETAAKLLQQLKSCAGLSQVGTNAITETIDEYGVKTVQFIVNGLYQPVK